MLVTHLMTRQVDSDVLPQLVSGELVVDKILKLLLQSCHEVSAWKKYESFTFPLFSKINKYILKSLTSHSFQGE